MTWLPIIEHPKASWQQRSMMKLGAKEKLIPGPVIISWSQENKGAMSAYDELKPQNSKEKTAEIALFDFLTNNESLLRKPCLTSSAKTDDTVMVFIFIRFV